MDLDWSDEGRGDRSSEHPTNFDNGTVLRIWEAIGYDRRCTTYIAHVLGPSWLRLYRQLAMSGLGHNNCERSRAMRFDN